MPRNIRICNIGVRILEFFLVTSTAIVLYLFWFGLIAKTLHFSANPAGWVLIGTLLFVAELALFWIGIVLVYVSSLQLGIRTRIFGAVCGWIPLINLYALVKIIRICRDEVALERDLVARDLARQDKKICKTRYPLLLVHGVFFRDFEHLNYWGRIPKELIKNGAEIYYGEHNSASAVADSAVELEKRIQEIVQKTGCEKVNVIAHSKGGLDTRMAIATTSAGKYIASLTTINTPHRGCEFADYLLTEIPESGQKLIADKYNQMAAKLGDKDPDFLAAVYDLTSTRCRERNEVIKDDPNIYYQSVGSVLREASSGQFPLNYTYHLVRYFDGENDGLVGTGSFEWGESFQMLRNDKSKRGISHGDMIDLNRENIKGFDIREFYVQLVSGLREKGF